MLSHVTPNFYECYGASGFGTLSVLTPAAMREKPDSVGRPPSFVEIEAVGRQGDRLPSGTVGRLRCRGSASKGFAAENDVEGDERFRDGWYYPGDIGSIDDQGYIFIKGRTVDLIQLPGQRYLFVGNRIGDRAASVGAGSRGGRLAARQRAG
jgi:acyl-coenzyme A synthetase/AMP-(fatty) acid ligase